LGQETPPEEAKEEWPVVGCRPDVEPVVREKCRSPGPKQRDSGIIERRLRQPVIVIGLVAPHAGIPGDIELPLGRKAAQVGDLVAREAAILHQQCGRVPAMQERQPLPRINFAGAGPDICLQRRDRSGKQLDRVPWRVAEPAGDGDEAVRVQMVEIGLERLDRIDRTFAEGQHTGCGRRIGIEQRELDQVPASAASRDEAARLGHVEGDLRAPIDMAGKLTEFAVSEITDLTVQLHCIGS